MKPAHRIWSVREHNLDNQPIVPFGIAGFLHQNPDKHVDVVFQGDTQLWEVGIEEWGVAFRFTETVAWKPLELSRW